MNDSEESSESTEDTASVAVEEEEESPGSRPKRGRRKEPTGQPENPSEPSADDPNGTGKAQPKPRVRQKKQQEVPPEVAPIRIEGLVLKGKLQRLIHHERRRDLLTPELPSHPDTLRPNERDYLDTEVPASSRIVILVMPPENDHVAIGYRFNTETKEFKVLKSPRSSKNREILEILQQRSERFSSIRWRGEEFNIIPDEELGLALQVATRSSTRPTFNDPTWLNRIYSHLINPSCNAGGSKFLTWLVYNFERRQANLEVMPYGHLLVQLCKRSYWGITIPEYLAILLQHSLLKHREKESNAGIIQFDSTTTDLCFFAQALVPPKHICRPDTPLVCSNKRDWTERMH